MNISKTIRLSKAVDFILYCLQLLMLYLAAISLGDIFIAVFKDKIPDSAYVVFGNMTLHLFKSTIPDTSALWPSFAFSMVTRILKASTGWYLLHGLRQIVKPMKFGQPLEGNLSHRFKTLAWVSLAVGVVTEIVRMIGEWAEMKAYHLDSMFDRSMVESVSFNHSIHWLFPVLSGFLFLLYFVFQYENSVDQLQEINGKVYSYLWSGDVAGAITYMKTVPELESTAKRYIDLFENEHYVRYKVPDELNRILLCYQHYYRDVFYLRRDKAEADSSLINSLQQELGMPGCGLTDLTNEITLRFNKYGYQIQCGLTLGYFGPCVWKNTIRKDLEIELPEITNKYSVNLVRRMITRSWLDYISFGQSGTGGWA